MLAVQFVPIISLNWLVMTLVKFV